MVFGGEGSGKGPGTAGKDSCPKGSRESPVSGLFDALREEASADMPRSHVRPVSIAVIVRAAAAAVVFFVVFSVSIIIVVVIVIVVVVMVVGNLRNNFAEQSPSFWVPKCLPHIYHIMLVFSLLGRSPQQRLGRRREGDERRG